MRFSLDDRKRFAEKYIPEPNSGCWIWIAALNRYGYGHFMMRRPKRMERAHRVSYLMAGYKIPRGKLLRHTCDVRCCVNPAHLVPGTQFDNMRECLERGRFCCGAAHHSAKLTGEEIFTIRQSVEPQKLLAARYGVHRNTIGDIRRRKLWKHL